MAMALVALLALITVIGFAIRYHAARRRPRQLARARRERRSS